MEIGTNVISASWLFLTLLYYALAVNVPQMHIIRGNSGDMFSIYAHSDVTNCTTDLCAVSSNGTAVPKGDLCTCQCLPNVPTYREDLEICVDDIRECRLVPFANLQRISSIFLPQKDQAVTIGKEIDLKGEVCTISESKVITQNGLVYLRNSINYEIPFEIHNEDDRNFLRWTGPSELRSKLLGKLVILDLTCKETVSAGKIENITFNAVTNCVAFKILDLPEQPLQNINEVAFIPDANLEAEILDGNHMSTAEYVTITICSILIGLIYVASVFFYLHLRKKNKSVHNEKEQLNQGHNANLRDLEEGTVKNNPLLALSSNFFHMDSAQSDSTSSDNETTADIVKLHEDKSKQLTSALVHHQKQKYLVDSFILSYSLLENNQDSTTNERLPEEDVSIIETLEGRDDNTDNPGYGLGSIRKKLYFNPAYFEPQLLLAPPPAALEFLTKIREVIATAKVKLAAKRFAPSLLNIPEEDNYFTVDPYRDLTKTVSRQSSTVSLKRENSRKKLYSDCPNCDTNCPIYVGPKLAEIPTLFGCHTCTSTNTESKQRSIRKWLENVPIHKNGNESVNHDSSIRSSVKRIRSPTQVPPEGINSVDVNSNCKNVFQDFNFQRQNSLSRNIPDCSKAGMVENIYDTVSEDGVKNTFAEICTKKENIDTLTKKQMNAVINEFTVQKNLMIPQVSPLIKNRADLSGEYDTDSLERKKTEGFATPTEYADILSSQPSPCLSVALPVQEEITMRNAIFDKKIDISAEKKKSTDLVEADEHDYELIILKKGTMNESGYNLPELLQKSHEYSLVSEVYVNNGYNYESAPSTPGSSAYSSLEKKTLKVRYEEGIEKPGKLLIEVQDCADHYIPVHESDSFEPDTLDRKYHSKKLNGEYTDSLERPTQILLRTTGSFRNDQFTSKKLEDKETSNFNRVFGSLREIYEAKNKQKYRNMESRSLRNSFTEGRILTLEERHARRQRAKEQIIPPDLILPTPNAQDYSNNSLEFDHKDLKPPLPPKNGKCRGVDNYYANTVVDCLDIGKFGTPNRNLEDYELCLIEKSKKNGNITRFIQTENLVLKKGPTNELILPSSVLPPKLNPKTSNGKYTWGVSLKPEDSGYLSTDSNDSQSRKTKYEAFETNAGSETDESLGDGHSESGAESVETHSVFFNRFSRKPANFGSKDSGMMGEEEVVSSSDSESMSFTTIVPVTTC